MSVPPPPTPRSHGHPHRSRSASTAGLRFPLPENTFPPIHVSDAQLAVYHEAVQRQVKQALLECARCDDLGRRMFPSPWEEVGSTEGITAMRRKDPVTSGRAEYRVFGHVGGDFRHAMEFYYSETARELFETFQYLLEYAVDAAILRTLEHATEDNPHHYMGLKWVGTQPSVFASKCDVCFVEYMTYTKDEQGRDVGIYVMLPTDLPEVDHIMDALKVRRFRSKLVFVFRPGNSVKPTTQVFALIDNIFPFFVPSSYNKTVLNFVRKLPFIIQSKRITRRGLTPRSKWVRNSARKSCTVCTRAFNATRGRHHCRLCGEIMCRRCVAERLAPEYTSDRTFKLIKVKFCLVCIGTLAPIVSGQRSASMTLASSPTRSRVGYESTRSDDQSRQSFWSETESEDYGTEMSDSGGRLSLASLTDSDWSSEKQSFAARLTAPRDRIEEEEDATLAPEEMTFRTRMGVTEVIDTADMIPDSQLRAQFAMASPTGDDSYQFFGDRRGSNPGMKGAGPGVADPTARSLDQCLAEQEELLRRMVIAANHHPAPPPEVTTDKRQYVLH